MKASDFKCVKEANEIAKASLRYYNSMMEIKVAKENTKKITSCRYLGSNNKCLNIHSNVVECVLLKPNLTPGVYIMCKLEHGMPKVSDFFRP